MKLCIRVPILFAVGLILAGCETLPHAYMASGKTQQDLLRDRYECYRETQQRVSGASVNRYGGSASSNVIPSCGAFNACLASRGYIYSKERGTLVVPKGAEITCNE